MRESNLNIISSCCALLNQPTPPSKTLAQLCRHLAEAFNLRVCLIVHFDQTGTRLLLDASHGLFVDEIQPHQEAVSLIRDVLRRKHVMNTPIRNGKTLDGHIVRASVATRCGSLLAQPLMLGGRAIGLLMLLRKARQAFPKGIADIVSVFSTTLAAYLANASGGSRETEADERPAARGDQLSESFRRGQPVVPGVAYGKCLLLAGDDALQGTNLQYSDDISAQRTLLERVYRMARETLESSRGVVNDLIAEADDGIFEMYVSLMEDPTIRQRIEGHLSDGYTVDSALSLTYKDFAQEFRQIDDEYLRERLLDVEDIILRLLNASRNLTGKQREGIEEPIAANDPVILVTSELFTSQLIASPLRQVRGIVCQTGGATSHATILARALHIPMMTGLPGIHKLLTPKDSLLLDCQSGLCFQNPSESLLAQYKLPLEATRRSRENHEEDAAPLDDQPKTRDGTAIRLTGNVTLFSELPTLRSVGIRDVGLYRTEFMFMIRNSTPDEDTQYRVFSRLVEGCNGAPVVLRALDVGGDKPLQYFKWEDELNPSLGWRGLRFLLAEENHDFAMTHCRAILRVAARCPNLRVMFPMVADLHDLRQAKALLAQAAESLKEAGQECGSPRVGIMVELPSAALSLEQLLPESDFVSVGTNDLVQYLFGADRGNSRVAQWYRQCHPIIFRLLGQICAVAARHPGKHVAICGELAGNLRALPALLGAGLRFLSMNPATIPPVRDYIRRVDLGECRSLYQNVCRCSTAQEAHALLDSFWKLHLT